MHGPYLRRCTLSLFFPEGFVTKQSRNIDRRRCTFPRGLKALLSGIELSKNRSIKISDVLHEFVRLTKLIVRIPSSLVYRKKEIMIHDLTHFFPRGITNPIAPVHVPRSTTSAVWIIPCFLHSLPSFPLVTPRFVLLVPACPVDSRGVAARV